MDLRKRAYADSVQDNVGAMNTQHLYYDTNPSFAAAMAVSDHIHKKVPLALSPAEIRDKDAAAFEEAWAENERKSTVVSAGTPGMLSYLTSFNNYMPFKTTYQNIDLYTGDPCPPPKPPSISAKDRTIRADHPAAPFDADGFVKPYRSWIVEPYFAITGDSYQPKTTEFQRNWADDFESRAFVTSLLLAMLLIFPVMS